MNIENGHEPGIAASDDKGVAEFADTDKAFASRQAAHALHVHGLHRRDQSESGAAYWAERWGLVKCLPTIDAARRLFEVIGGRL